MSHNHEINKYDTLNHEFFQSLPTNSSEENALYSRKYMCFQKSVPFIKCMIAYEVWVFLKLEFSSFMLHMMRRPNDTVQCTAQYTQNHLLQKFYKQAQCSTNFLCFQDGVRRLISSMHRGCEAIDLLPHFVVNCFDIVLLMINIQFISLILCEKHHCHIALQ